MSDLPASLLKILGTISRFSEPITVADSAARKSPSSYVSPHPIPGITRVRQADAPDAVYVLGDKDVTQDSSWIAGSADVEGLAASIAAAQSAADEAQSDHDDYAAKKGSWSGIPVIGNPGESAEFVLIEDQGAFPTGLDIINAVAGSVPKIFANEHSGVFTLSCTAQPTIVALQPDETCILFPINGLWVPFVFSTGERTVATRVAAPASAAAAGEEGQFAFDSDFFYVCVAPDTWKRTALSAW